MAPRNTRTQSAPAVTADDAPAASGFDFGAVTVTQSTLPKITKAGKANPLLPFVQRSLDEGVALMVPNIPEPAVKEAENMLRRGAKNLGCGIRIRLEVLADGNSNIHFTASAVKRKARYTAGQVREWAQENGYARDKLFPRVKAEVSAAYRVAHADELSA